ncbi:uncharacterized protein LOC120333822 [Styela clava]
MKLPVIDFASCAIRNKNISTKDLKSVGESIVKAFHSAGFVYLKDTGISENDVKKLNKTAKQFFDLPMEKKKKYDINQECFGYIGIGVEKNSALRPADYKEGFDIPGSAFVPGRTIWPDKEVAEYSYVMKEFGDHCRFLSTQILGAISLGLGLKDKEYLMKCHSRMNDERNLTTLRTHYYPRIPDKCSFEPGQVRLGEHTDFGSFTILFQDKVGGLQVKASNGEYVDATPIPGTALVNIGDALQFWTQGRLKSTEHRILMPKTAEENVERRSIAYFVQANNDVLLSELQYENNDIFSPREASQVSDEPVTVLQYLKKQYKSINLQSLDHYSE